MERNIKQKAIRGMYYSFISIFVNNGLNFIVSILLARLLDPKDYGLLGIVMIFISLSNIFIDSGLSTALVREKEVSEIDYSTVYFYNLILSLFLYSLLFILAKPISSYFNEEILVILIRVVGLNLIIGALGNIQRVKYSRALNFKIQSKIDVSTVLVTSIIGITMALNGFGVWTLVTMQICTQGISTLLYIISSKWIPKFSFSISRLKQFFGFGSKMLLSGLFATIYNNVYNMIFGKSYSTAELGYYTKSKSIKDMLTNTIVGTVGRVSYPVLSKLHTDKGKLSEGFTTIIKHVNYLVFPVFIGILVLSDPLVRVVFGERWLHMIPYLRIFSISALLYPHNALNLNVLQVVGRSDLFLKADLITMFASISMITISLVSKLGIIGLFSVMIATPIISFLVNALYARHFINYGIKQQIMDMIPALFLSLIMGVIVYAFINFFVVIGVKLLVSAILLGVTSYVTLSFIFKNNEFFSILKIIRDLIEK